MLTPSLGHINLVLDNSHRESSDKEKHSLSRLFLKEFVTINKLLGDLFLPALKLHTK